MVYCPFYFSFIGYINGILKFSKTTYNDLSTTGTGFKPGSFRKIGTKTVILNVNFACDVVVAGTVYSKSEGLSSSFLPKQSARCVLAIISSTNVIQGFAWLQIDTSGNCSFVSNISHSVACSYIGTLVYFTN